METILSTLLDDVLGGRSHVRVLRALHRAPRGVPMSGREVARRAGVSHPTAAAILGTLLDRGLVTVLRRPGFDAYGLETAHALARPLGALFDWEEGISDELVKALGRRILVEIPSARAAFVFGSAARGEMTPESDLDVAVVCRPQDEEAAWEGMGRVVEWVRPRYGVHVSPIVGVGTPQGLARAGRPGAKLWRTILEEGIPLIDAPRRGAARA